VLYAWHPGSEGGAALGELLFGLTGDGQPAAPSGRLRCLPRATGQAPIYYNHKNSGRPVAASLAVSGQLLSRYVDLPSTPLFPFGHGLTYTSFEYSGERISSETLRVGGSVTISALVTNTGPRPGVEVAQLYVRDGSARSPAVRELKGFQRLALAPGESQRVSFTSPRPTWPSLAPTARARGARELPGLGSADCQSGSPLEFRSLAHRGLLLQPNASPRIAPRAFSLGRPSKKVP